MLHANSSRHAHAWALHFVCAKISCHDASTVARVCTGFTQAYVKKGVGLTWKRNACTHTHTHTHTHTRTEDTLTRVSARFHRYEVQKFQREAYLLRSLLHPGVLRVFGFCKVFFVRESRTSACFASGLHTHTHRAFQHRFLPRASDIPRELQPNS